MLTGAQSQVNYMTYMSWCAAMLESAATRHTRMEIPVADTPTSQPLYREVKLRIMRSL